MRSSSCIPVVLFLLFCQSSAKESTNPQCSPVSGSGTEHGVDFVFLLDHSLGADKVSRIQFLYKAISCEVPVSQQYRLATVHIPGKSSKVDLAGWQTSAAFPDTLFRGYYLGGRDTKPCVFLRDAFKAVTSHFAGTGSTLGETPIHFVVPVTDMPGCKVETEFRRFFGRNKNRFNIFLDIIAIENPMEIGDVGVRVKVPQWANIETKVTSLTTHVNFEDIYKMDSVLQEYSGWIKSTLQGLQINDVFLLDDTTIDEELSTLEKDVDNAKITELLTRVAFGRQAFPPKPPRVRTARGITDKFEPPEPLSNMRVAKSSDSAGNAHGTSGQKAPWAEEKYHDDADRKLKPNVVPNEDTTPAKKGGRKNGSKEKPVTSAERVTLSRTPSRAKLATLSKTPSKSDRVTLSKSPSAAKHIVFSKVPVMHNAAGSVESHAVAENGTKNTSTAAEIGVTVSNSSVSAAKITLKSDQTSDNSSTIVRTEARNKSVTSGSSPNIVPQKRATDKLATKSSVAAPRLPAKVIDAKVIDDLKKKIPKTTVRTKRPLSTARHGVAKDTRHKIKPAEVEKAPWEQGEKPKTKPKKERKVHTTSRPPRKVQWKHHQGGDDASQQQSSGDAQSSDSKGSTGSGSQWRPTFVPLLILIIILALIIIFILICCLFLIEPETAPTDRSSSKSDEKTPLVDRQSGGKPTSRAAAPPQPKEQKPQSPPPQQESTAKCDEPVDFTPITISGRRSNRKDGQQKDGESGAPLLNADEIKISHDTPGGSGHDPEKPDIDSPPKANMPKISTDHMF
ncbi:hypothetical protein RB195_003301 [Necator americanus]|uniref:Uncharacterized protein n=1 Tax=Necator americanus TaxID=51031 RepID=A0ABR1DNA3_NECAM